MMNGFTRAVVAFVVMVWLGADSTEAADPPIRVGSKQFTESVILGEILTKAGSSLGLKIEHRADLGGTGVVWQALTGGEIDLYVITRAPLLKRSSKSPGWATWRRSVEI